MVHDKDVGTTFTLDTSEDVSAAIAMRIYYRDPNGDTGYLEAEAVDGHDTWIQATKVLTAMRTAGTWTLQSWVQWEAGVSEFYGTPVSLEIGAAIV